MSVVDVDGVKIHQSRQLANDQAAHTATATNTTTVSHQAHELAPKCAEIATSYCCTQLNI